MWNEGVLVIFVIEEEVVMAACGGLPEQPVGLVECGELGVGELEAVVGCLHIVDCAVRPFVVVDDSGQEGVGRRGEGSGLSLWRYYSPPVVL